MLPNRHGIDSPVEFTPLLSGESIDRRAVSGIHGAMVPPPTSAPPPPPPPLTTEHSNDGLATNHDMPNQNRTNIISSFPSSSGEDNISQSSNTGKLRKKKMKLQDSSSTTSGAGSKAMNKKKDGPHKSMCHLIFDVVRWSAIISCFMMFLTQTIPLIIFIDESTWLQIAVR